MEKITYVPLIRHLKESEDRYNQLYREAELRFGSLSKPLIVHWMINSIEPIIRLNTEENIPKVFHAFYSELLQLLGGQQGIIYEQEYQSAWLICKENLSLLQIAPSRMIKAINSAIVSVRSFQPAKVSEWIALMSRVTPQCRTIDEFLICGRIGAWMCGLAQLRAKALESLNQLPASLKELLINDKQDLLSQTWINGKTPAFIKEVGGFRGMNGPFIHPPKVALIDTTIFATDAKHSCALFADHFGNVILPDVPVSSNEIIRQSNSDSLTKFRKSFGKEIVPFDDISSCVMLNATFVISRHTSHYLFIYGWSN